LSTDVAREEHSSVLSGWVCLYGQHILSCQEYFFLLMKKKKKTGDHYDQIYMLLFWESNKEMASRILNYSHLTDIVSG